MRATLWVRQDDDSSGRWSTETGIGTGPNGPQEGECHWVWYLSETGGEHRAELGMPSMVANDSERLDDRGCFHFFGRR